MNAKKMKGAVCDMDCFNCKFDDCINDGEGTSREKEKARRREIYWERRQRGVCIRCQAPSGSKARCPECNALQKAYVNARREGLPWKLPDILPLGRPRGEGPRKTQHELYIKRRQKRLQEGLCLWCGNVIDDKEYKLCSACRKKARERARAVRERMKEEAKHANSTS